MVSSMVDPVIFKHNLMVGFNGLMLHEGYKVLHFAQDPKTFGHELGLSAWIMQDRQANVVQAQIWVVGTGKIPVSITKPVLHFGTAVCADGLVWHALIETPELAKPALRGDTALSLNRKLNIALAALNCILSMRDTPDSSGNMYNEALQALGDIDEVGYD